MCNHSHELPPTQLSLSRRALVGTAWAAPAIYATTLVPAYAASPSQTQPPVLNGHANVVVVVRFADDAVGDGATGFNKLMADNSTSYWQSLKQEFAPTGIPYISTSLSMPLTTYIDKVSNNQWPITTSYVQDPSGQGKTIQYITLPKAMASYSTDFEILRDTMLAIKNLSPDTTNWDLDHDGKIDNLSIVVQLPVGKDPYSSGSALVPHHSQNPSGVQINGMDIQHFLILPAKQNSYGGFTIGASNDTIKHEYLHTVGIWDLYRGGDIGNTIGDTPVGVWSIMAQANRNWPLAQERLNLGWTTIPTLDLSQQKSTQVTLYPQYSASGNQAVRIVSPYDPNESFVIEYRQQATSRGEIDYRIPASGAIIYRVANGMNNTHSGQSNISMDGQVHDYIYVFRQDSESTTVGLKPATAVLNTTGIQSFGSADLASTANAVLDTQGRNTGLVVKVVSQTNGSITLDITQTDTATVSLWTQVGAPLTNATMGGSLAASATSLARVGVAFDGAQVQTLAGSAWSGTTAPFSGGYGQAQIAYLGDTLYAAAPNYNTSSIDIKKLVNGQWTTVTSVSNMGDNPFTFTSSAGVLYIAGATNGAGNQGRVYSSQGAGFTQVGGTISGQYLSDFALTNNNGTVQVAVSDVFGNNHKIYTLQGSNWVASQTDSRGSKTMALLANGTSTYELLLDNGTLSVRVFSASGQLQKALTPNGLPGSVSGASMAISGDKAIVAVQSGQTITVYTSPLSDLSNWTKLGENVTTSTSTPDVEVLNGTVYVLTSDGNASTVTVFEHSL